MTPAVGQRAKPFYGWAVVAVATLVMFSSGPGQSYVFSIFTDSILTDTGMTRTHLSALYAVGTFFSAGVSLLISSMVERFGSRWMLAAVAILFGLACFGMSMVSGSISVLLGFASLRAMGQGSLTTIATLLTVQWFVRYRGRAVAILSLGIAASNAFFPLVTRWLIDSFGWRQAYQALGWGLWVVLVPLVILVVRDTPEKVGLHPDGLAPTPEMQQQTLARQGKRPKVWTSLRFWLLAIPLTAGPFVTTALVFHQTSVFAEHGLSPEVAASVFIALALASACTTPIAGLIAEKVPAAGLMYGVLFALSSAALLAMVINSAWMAVVYAALLGMAGGIQGVVGGVAWAEAYGRENVAPAQGASALLIISASAIAPLPFAALQQYFGSYGQALWLMVAIPVICAGVLTVAMVVNRKAARG
jgi:MFS family permease